MSKGSKNTYILENFMNMLLSWLHRSLAHKWTVPLLSLYFYTRLSPSFGSLLVSTFLSHHSYSLFSSYLKNIYIYWHFLKLSPSQFLFSHCTSWAISLMSTISIIKICLPPPFTISANILNYEIRHWT